MSRQTTALPAIPYTVYRRGKRWNWQHDAANLAARRQAGAGAVQINSMRAIFDLAL